MTGRNNGMEIAHGDDLAHKPDGLQGTAEDRTRIQRCINHIHAARAALAAAEDDLSNPNCGRVEPFRIAAALSLAIAEAQCFHAAAALAELGDKYQVRPGTRHDSPRRPPVHGPSGKP